MDRPVIDAETLLERVLHPVYTKAAQQYFQNKTVLVTGAGGSIGGEIVKQLLKLRVGEVVCLDRDEYALYKLELKIHGTALLTSESLILADIHDHASIRRIMAAWQPDVVFHAAAVKHLPLLERSPDSAFKTNVLGTMNVIRAASECGVERFVNVSTDKAADPTSVLGYSKRIAEMIASYYSQNKMIVASVRFGNVFASRGSFIETLQWQVANERSVTITNPDVTRYFMSIPQAAGLVIETALIAKSGNTYVLDMGEPVKIIDVVQRYVELTNSKPPVITFSGLRKGEKKHEVLYDVREKHSATEHNKIYSVRVSGGDEVLLSDIESLRNDMSLGTLSLSSLATELKRLAHDTGQRLNITLPVKEGAKVVV